jgi:CheY-like chemotaxis protein
MLAAASAARSAEPKGCTMIQEPGRLLIVDDDAITRALLRRFLEPKGFAIVEAADGAEAQHWLARGPCDLVLLDVLLPGASGLAVLRQLRQAYAVTDLPTRISQMASSFRHSVCANSPQNPAFPTTSC